jgi:GNAT superfamily N-acetyltransferase
VSDIDYREGFAAPDFLALARDVWPRDYSLEQTAAALTHTLNLGAWDRATLVGSVRLLTDGYFYATIPEILVAPPYRGRGIGAELMRRIVARAPKGTAAFAAQPQSVAFFERIGCERRLTSFVARAPLPHGETSRCDARPMEERS